MNISFGEKEEKSKLNILANKSKDKIINEEIDSFNYNNKAIITRKINNIFEISKSGFQGANIDKTNQDNFVVAKNIFYKEKETYFFAVL